MQKYKNVIHEYLILIKTLNVSTINQKI